VLLTPLHYIGDMVWEPLSLLVAHAFEAWISGLLTSRYWASTTSSAFRAAALPMWLASWTHVIHRRGVGVSGDIKRRPWEVS
jgi:hypothetical protein